MKSKLLNPNPKTYAVIFETGDEAMAGLKTFAKEHALSASQVTGIGAFAELELAYFDPETKEYRKIPIREQVEVLSFLGDITLDDAEPKLHIHVVVGKADATAHGGHLVSGRVRPTLEVLLTESPKHLRRKPDPQSGLALIDPEAGP